MKLTRALARGGLVGLFALSLNLIIPVIIAYIKGSRYILYEIKGWERGIEAFILLFLGLLGLFAVIRYWRIE